MPRQSWAGIAPPSPNMISSTVFRDSERAKAEPPDNGFYRGTNPDILHAYIVREKHGQSALHSGAHAHDIGLPRQHCCPVANRNPLCHTTSESRP